MGNDQHNLSRRDFLKATVLGMGATFLAALILRAKSAGFSCI